MSLRSHFYREFRSRSVENIRLLREHISRGERVAEPDAAQYERAFDYVYCSASTLLGHLATTDGSSAVGRVVLDAGSNFTPCDAG